MSPEIYFYGIYVNDRAKVGTPFYMYPEIFFYVIDVNDYDPYKSDVYSLGFNK